MKHLLLNILLALTAFACFPTLNMAQSKALEKEVKKTCKKWRKEGWTMIDMRSTMEYALMKYRMYVDEDEDNRIAITGIAIGRNTKIGRDHAILNGLSNYATRAKAQIVGNMKSIMATDGAGDGSEEIDKFAAAYESSFNARIASLVKEHFALTRDKDGKKEFIVYMTIDEAAANKARHAAAEEAKNKANLGNLAEHLDEITNKPVEAE